MVLPASFFFFFFLLSSSSFLSFLQNQNAVLHQVRVIYSGGGNCDPCATLSLRNKPGEATQIQAPTTPSSLCGNGSSFPVKLAVKLWNGASYTNLDYENHRFSTTDTSINFRHSFVQGGKASLLLDENGDRNHSIENQAIPNQTSRGFVEQECLGTVSCADMQLLAARDSVILCCDASSLVDENGHRNHSTEKMLYCFDKIDSTKEEMQQACPGNVSCEDTLAPAARNSTLLAGGPLYPVLIGSRRGDRNHQSLIEEALARDENPRPDDIDNITSCTFNLRSDDIDNITSYTLHLFNLRRINGRETVSLVEIGKKNWSDVIQQDQNKLNNTISSDKESKENLVMSKPKPKEEFVIAFLFGFVIAYLFVHF